MRAFIVIAALAACALPSRIVVTGTVTKVDRDERYEPVCSIMDRVRHECNDLHAYHAFIVDTTGKRVDFWFFTSDTYGFGTPPREGENVTLRLTRRAIYQLARCAQQRAMSASCPSDQGYALDSTENIIRRNYD